MATAQVAVEKPTTLQRSSGHQTSFAVMIFLGAFLLFQVQLIVAKQLLPWFGGSAGVWNTCLVFFQVLLLGGYAYAHGTMARLSPRLLVRIHLGVLLVSIGLLSICAVVWRSPIYPGDSLRPQSAGWPVWHILILLSATVGLPFFLLSTTGPLAQSWLTRTNRGTSPYRLYALSNLGSLLGLVTYPVLFEPILTLRNQGRLWAFGYLAYAVAATVCAIRFQRASDSFAGPAVAARIAHHVPVDSPELSNRLLWFALAASGCVLLLSVTNLICQEIAVVPFLWVLPLSIYLVSFILCFQDRLIYRRSLFHIAFGAVSVWAGVQFLLGERVKVFAQIGWFGLLLFVACMVYHGELARLKPRPHHLTSFYLHIAAGGAFGTMLVGFIAPYVFPAVWEFQVGLLISGFVVAAVLWKDRQSWLHRHPRWLAAAVALSVLAAADYIGISVTILHTKPVYLHVVVGACATLTAFIVAAGPRVQARHTRILNVTLLCAWCLFGMFFWVQVHRQLSHSVLMTRNFYGVLRVEYNEPVQSRYALLEKHGLTLHGAQLQAPGRRAVPTLYYGPSSGIGLALASQRGAVQIDTHPFRMGVIGLGAGTLAAYGRAGDYLRFYEMNPEVARLAKGNDALFSFLNDTPAQNDIVLGDGRISLERELASGTPQNFDILAIDAFSSDSIPVHLLTREAMGIYLRNLRSARSILAFNISNRTLDLAPVLAGLAQQYHLSLVRVLTLRPRAEAESPSDWILMSADPAALQTPAILSHAQPVSLAGRPLLWTDDYSNVLRVLR